MNRVVGIDLLLCASDFCFISFRAAVGGAMSTDSQPSPVGSPALTSWFPSWSQGWALLQGIWAGPLELAGLFAKAV